MTQVSIRPAQMSDATAVAGIYNHYVLNSIATFEEDPVSDEAMAARIQQTLSTGMPWLVATEADRILGYAYAGAWKARSAYRHSVEITVYLDAGATGTGLGTRLYEALFARLRELPVHLAIGGIALPNAASIALHERFGMHKVAHFREVGYKFGRWVDVAYWQLRLDGSIG